MKIKEITSVKKEKTYELTEEELKQIIKTSYNLSKKHLTSYIVFCYKNYIYKMNISGICDFLSELLEFLCDIKDYISNTKNNLSYLNYRKNNFYCPWDTNNFDKLI